MANEFTKQLSDVTVPDAPQLRTNTGSDAGDILSAVNFGLQAFSQFKQKEQLQEQAVAQQESSSRTNKAALGLRELRSLAETQGLGRTKMLDRESKILKTLSPQEQIEAIKLSNQLTGTTTYAVGGSVDKGIKDDIANQESKQLKADEDRMVALKDFQEISPYYTGENPIDPSTSSLEEIQLATLEAIGGKAKVQAKVTDIGLEADKLSFKKNTEAYERDVGIRQMSVEFLAQTSANVQQVINASVMDSSPEGRGRTLQTIDVMKEQVVTNFMKRADKSLGIKVTLPEAQAQLKPFLDSLDQAKKAYSGEYLVDATDNELKLTSNQLMIAAKQDAPEAFVLLTLKNAGVDIQGVPLAQEKLLTLVQGRALDLSPEGYDEVVATLAKTYGKEKALDMSKQIQKQAVKMYVKEKGKGDIQVALPEVEAKKSRRAFSTALSTDDEDFIDNLNKGTVTDVLDAVLSEDTEGLDTNVFTTSESVEKGKRQVLNASEKLLTVVATKVAGSGVTFENGRMVPPPSDSVAEGRPVGLLPKHFNTVNHMNRYLEGIKKKYPNEYPEIVKQVEAILQPQQVEGKE